jgi:hypothetical protein
VQGLQRTLTITNRVGESVTGFSQWGPRFEKVGIARTIPSLKKAEDAEAILRCGFLDLGAPFEVNLIVSDSIRTVLQQRVLTDPDTDGWLNPESLFTTHPWVGYLPPELFSSPNAIGLRVLAGTGNVGGPLTGLRFKPGSISGEGIDWSKAKTADFVSDENFWSNVAASNLYPSLIGNLLSRGESLRLALLAPPVPVLHEDWVKSPDLQYELNTAAAVLMKPAAGTTPNLRPLYSVHLHPSALRHVTILQSAIDHVRLALTGNEFGFMGVHLSFTDLGSVAIDGAPAIRSAKDFVARIVSAAADRGRFTMVSDTGPVGPAFLDLGAAFTTYGPGMTMRRTYPFMQAPKEKTPAVKKRVRESKYGMVLGGPWNYILLRFRDVREQGWKLELLDKKAEHVVPEPLRRKGMDDRYRVEFSKPYNAAVQEMLNDLRDRELNGKKNAKPGQSILGRSDDPTISPWA